MGIAVAGATYSVNIELNHQSLNKQLDDLNTKVNTIGKSSAKKAATSKDEEKTLTSTNNLLNSNAVQYGRGLRLNKKGVSLELQKANYLEATSKILDGDFKKAREIISDSKVRNTQEANNLITQKEVVKTKGKGLRVSRQMAESIDAMDKAQHKNFALRTKLDDLERKGVNVYQERLKYGQLNAAQGKREFGSVKKIASSLDLDLKRKAAKFRWQNKINQATAKELEIRRKMGGATSPIRGDAIRNEGSPAWMDRSARMGGPSSKLNYQRGRLLPGPLGTGGRGASSGVWQSAAISGAFPLLFGQGPVTAAAGALGGGLGAKYGGQMGGFAGGLAATAAVTTITNAVNAVKELGQAMGPFTQDTSALIAATGQGNTFREKELKLIEELQGKQEAFNEAMKDMTALVGQKGVEALKQFGEDTKRLSDDWARFMTQMSAGLAKLINWSGLLGGGTKSIARRREELAGSDTELYRLQQERKDILTGFTGTRAERKAALDQNMEDTRLRLIEYDKEQLDLQDKKLAKYNAEEEAVKRINSLYKDIGGTIKDGLVQGIQAAIDGTKSLGEIAGSVFKKISNALLDFGVSTLLQNLPIAGASKFFGGGKAAGGPVKSGKGYLVGEKGPELFTPSSSGRITPNNKLGGANIVVNVDASGSSVEGDEGQSAQLGNMLAQAIQSELVRQKRPGGLLAV